MNEVQSRATDEAIVIVGENRTTSGFALRAHEHASRLRSEGAAPLRRILESQPVAETIDRYERLDRIAMNRQAKFKRLCTWTLYAIALLTYLSLVALALPLSEDLQRVARFWALVVVYVGMFLAFLSLSWLHIGKPDVAWRQARAGAEIARARIFDVVMDASKGEKALLPLKLEYVRRYQLDLQEDYYKYRGEQHQRRVQHAFIWKLVFFFIAMLAVGAMLVIHFADKGEDGISFASRMEVASSFLLNSEAAHTDLVLLLAALALAIWWAISHTLAQIDGAARNAALFAIAHERLVRLRESTLEAARKAAADGDEAQVLRFIEGLQSVLTAEHQGWTAMEGTRRDAVQDLASA